MSDFDFLGIALRGFAGDPPAKPASDFDYWEACRHRNRRESLTLGLLAGAWILSWQLFILQVLNG